jgi:four helix bundle protein
LTFAYNKFRKNICYLFVQKNNLEKQSDMNGNIKKYDLEERLIEFSLLILDIVEKLPDTKSGNHFAGQLLRSGTSPALNYGEAQVAESRNDFIHKMKICLKELKELYIALQIIKRKPLITEYPNLDLCISECKELIAIFLKSIETANLNSKKLKTQHKKLKM